MQTSAPITPSRPARFFFGRRRGAPLAVVTAAGEVVQITPESLVLLIYARFWGFVWNWPLALSVDRRGMVERRRVVDVTRLALWALGLSTALLSVVLLARKPQP